MKKLLITISLLGVATLVAEPPRKDSLTKYRKLWESSLVTDKPIIEAPAPEDEIHALDDYVLGGYTRTTNGYFVSLINTKDAKDRLTIAPGMPGSAAYEVVDVRTDPTNFTKAEVLIKAGGKEKWIGYDEKHLTLRQPAAAKQPAQKQQQQQQRRTPVPTTNNTNNNSQQRQPRVRRRVPVPPQN